MGRTHMMTHTKREPRGRPRDPSSCRKTILETIKSLLISDYYKLVFLYRGITNSCLVKLNFTGWLSYFWLTFSWLKKIAKHFRKNPSETVVYALLLIWHSLIALVVVEDCCLKINSFFFLVTLFFWMKA